MKHRFAPAIILVFSLTPVACSLFVSSELDGKSSDPVSQDAGTQDVLDEGDAFDAAEQEAEAAPPDVTETSTEDAEAGGCDANQCGSECVDLMTDPNHCGVCDNVCPYDRECTGGVCEGGFRTTSEDGAPTPRLRACSAWTGEEMFVWGGIDGESNLLNSGGAYNPTTDTWREINVDGAPTARELANCVAMNGSVFVWSGADAAGLLDTGAVWDPSSNTWTSISDNNKPPPRVRGIALWTGERVLLWGGELFDRKQEKSGALFDPVTGEWKPISTNQAPERNREQGWAWTGTSLYTFGNRDDGGGQVTNAFHRYDPATDTWEAITALEAPAARSNAFMIWTGTGVLVWGGWNKDRVGMNDGAAFVPDQPTWTPLSTAQPPSARGCEPFRSGWKAWTGDRMIVAGGADINLVTKDLALYDPDSDPNLAWSPAIEWDPSHPHEYGVGVWSGKELILWGGTDGSLPTAGGSRWMP